MEKTTRHMLTIKPVENLRSLVLEFKESFKGRTIRIQVKIYRTTV